MYHRRVRPLTPPVPFTPSFYLQDPLRNGTRTGSRDSKSPRGQMFRFYDSQTRVNIGPETGVKKETTTLSHTLSSPL